MLPPVFSRNDGLQNKHLMKGVWSKMHMESQTQLPRKDPKTESGGVSGICGCNFGVCNINHSQGWKKYLSLTLSKFTF